MTHIPWYSNLIKFNLIFSGGKDLFLSRLLDMLCLFLAEDLLIPIEIVSHIAFLEDWHLTILIIILQLKIAINVKVHHFYSHAAGEIRLHNEANWHNTAPPSISKQIFVQKAF